jgi:diguanylate cyclase (GGDEF)-like protein
MSKKNWSPLFRYLPEIVLGLAAFLSLGLIMLPKEKLNRTLEFEPASYRADIFADAYSGGDSIAEWINRDAQLWRCQIGTAFKNPYCSMSIMVTSKEGIGLNLSHFDKMRIWVTYKGDAQHLRLYLKNRNPNYYVPGDPVTAKYNSIEVPIADLRNGLEIKMSDFTVASWWLVRRNLVLKEAHTEFNDIVEIEIQTGSAVSSGIHEIQLKKIVWQGPILTEVALYRGIAIAWSLLIIGALLYRLLLMQMEISRHKRYQEELVAINGLLSLQNQKFEDLAKTDHLTGLLNRIGIRDVLYDGLTHWKKNQTPFSMILIDLDHFKQVNDTYGHDVGDEILKNASNAFKNIVRKTDSLARWGGEEFILLCPGTNRVQAVAAAESLRKRLEAEPLFHEIKITASFGVATMNQPDLDHLFRSADEALYKAKKRGRNCVVTDARIADQHIH